MRFLEYGPNIPDELLLARDQGRVVFFCGAGVSRAKAELPDFFGLARNVLKRLGATEDNPAAKILKEVKGIESRTGKAGLISADRVFGLLESDFLVHDIEAAVAGALNPGSEPDLGVHNLLIDLATTEQGSTRIVTTNFDRLFDDCNPHIESWQPPRLPDLSHSDDMNGIVYLHGKATREYDGPEGDGFVLSGSDFGRAYLADGWATKFIREILEKYTVVFVGYTADDPPVHYLLEGLNGGGGKLDHVYAFQEGKQDVAEARWRHKGVEAISYESADGHKALWNTIEAWASRARNPDKWHDGVAGMARQGPEELRSYQRGQVAHLVSTLKGVRKFSGGDTPPPATWLCVFDKYRRYATPARSGRLVDPGPVVDPFPYYSLDSDRVPLPLDQEVSPWKRSVSDDAWDAFEPNRLDKSNLCDENLAAFRSYCAVPTLALPARIEQLGVWLSSVSHQKAAVWWAAHQAGDLHPRIQKLIGWRFQNTERDCGLEVFKAWKYLFEHWRTWNQFDDLEIISFDSEVKQFGWDSARLRRYAAIYKPYLTAGPASFSGPLAPVETEPFRLSDLVRVQVGYWPDTGAIEIPDEWLARVVEVRRRNLEIAVDLESEIDRYDDIDILPIVPDDGNDIDSSFRTLGLPDAALSYARLFERLAGFDLKAAQKEMSKWNEQDEHVFARFRIWSVGLPNLIPNEQAGLILNRLSARVFWNVCHQRDLMLVLRRRWNTLPLDARLELEKRVLAGPERWNNESEPSYLERRAESIANRLVWLANNGCELIVSVEDELRTLRRDVPDWKPGYAENKHESLESRVGGVQTWPEYAALLQEPLSNILARSEELRGRRENSFMQKDPFLGLCKSHPVKAFASLRLAAKADKYPRWAWQTFLYTLEINNDKAKFKAFIAETLSRMPPERLASIIHPLSEWLLRVCVDFQEVFPEPHERVVQALVEALRRNPNTGTSGLISGTREPDWIMEALNTPTRNIAQAFLEDPRTKGLKKGQGFPKDWLHHVEGLLGLDADLRRFAIVTFTHKLDWFYCIDPDWTHSNLLSVLRSGDRHDIEAWWSGYLSGTRQIPGDKLFQFLKPHLLDKAGDDDKKDKAQNDQLAGLILAGWGQYHSESGERLISNNEFRSVLLNGGDRFRARILWQLEHWSTGQDNDNVRWIAMLPGFLSNVWPIQKAAKTASASASLVTLVFSNAAQFLRVSEAILSHLIKIDRDHRLSLDFRQPNDKIGNIVDRYPERALSILWAVLPDDLDAWPYEMDATLDRIGNAKPALKKDKKLIELKRKWNSR